jgi:hypothetical protein
MIDKVDVKIPLKAHFTREFGELYSEIRNDPRLNPFRRSQHYESAGDLRKFGYDAVLHMNCIRDRKGSHKLELLDTGRMGYAMMCHEIERVFDLDARRLDLMRLDLAADVRGVRVAWFVRHMRAQYKRFACDIGQVDAETLLYARMGQQEVQTLYFGKRPNCFRVYDKIAEYRHQYARLIRGVSDAAELPTFEQVYGHPEGGVILTRVERQMGGGRIPKQVDTFAKLKAAAFFNPFDKLRFLGAAEQEPQIEACGFKVYAVGMWLRNSIEDIGFHRTRAFVNKHCGRHWDRIAKQYREFLPSADAGITPEQLFGIYRDSVRRQLAA